VRASVPELRAAAERQLARRSSAEGSPTPTPTPNPDPDPNPNPNQARHSSAGGSQARRGVAAAFDAVVEEVQAR
jgi:hypothetical protein